MGNFDELVLQTFLDNQDRLYDEPVAGTKEEADDFLTDCLAVLLDSEKEVYKYLEEEGMDVEDGIEDIAEVFPIPDGRFLIVEA
ncbi:MAG: glyoxalase [Lachnospiraceae bacterium]|nr:glyoxalase [Lachnospiraceae bacterium]